MTRSDRRLAATATGQLGAFSRAQAHDAGLTDVGTPDVVIATLRASVSPPIVA